ncbi:MAG: glycosyltransferase [Planctomycetota bacterium]|nr:glycosyltransferase [Planctomycetota bacterium]
MSVSVVLPVYNAGAFLAEALQSLADQTYRDLEIVVHDDGSTDDSRAIAEGFAARDERFVVQSAPNQGVAGAANAAVARARGDLLVRMDADDIAHPTRVAKLVALAAAHPEVEVLASRARYFPRAEVGPGMLRYEAWLDGLLDHAAIYADRFVEYPLPHPTTAVRRSAYERVGGFRDGDFPEDYDWFLRACAAGVRFAKHPDVLLDWREGGHRTTKSDARYSLASFHALKVEHLVPRLEAADREVAVVGAGRDGKRWARALRAAGVPLRCFVDLHPGRVGNTIQDLPVHSYEDLPSLRGAYLLSAVGAPGARVDIRARLTAAGFVEESDFLCVQ